MLTSTARARVCAALLILLVTTRPLMAEPSVWNLLVRTPSWVTQEGHYQSVSPRRPLVDPGKPYRCEINSDRIVCSEITDDGHVIPGTEREAR
ncbi:hypothetical protein H8A95_39230 [Bradyrhizobium sp. Pear76]|uniref:hypothetical protein n=1 Tax=Bradyrhizobium oropedii TaxID=1571201 RepID=UPI001E5001D3|nr:hypothetical protein [Bradyrhizobium oropedii]MCC8968181.1 hypothetical protein [Bradyrhizobium oropedii]